jgi:hypothetical protein
LLLLIFFIYYNDYCISSNETEGTIGIDQFMGEEDYTNHGFGAQIIKEFIKNLFENPAIKKLSLMWILKMAVLSAAMKNLVSNLLKQL